jgi:hypothetical protein
LHICSSLQSFIQGWSGNTPITTKFFEFESVHSIQHYVIKFVSDLCTYLIPNYNYIWWHKIFQFGHRKLSFKFWKFSPSQTRVSVDVSTKNPSTFHEKNSNADYTSMQRLSKNSIKNEFPMKITISKVAWSPS